MHFLVNSLHYLLSKTFDKIAIRTRLELDSRSVWPVNCAILKRAIRKLAQLWAACRRVDWLRHRRTPFSTMKKERVNFLSNSRVMQNGVESSANRY
jgi:hypothetical protein